MALSDDVTSLEAALVIARDASMAPADIVKLLDIAILTPVVEGGRIVASYQVNGRDVRMAISEARELRKYYAELANTVDGYDCLGITL